MFSSFLHQFFFNSYWLPNSLKLGFSLHKIVNFMLFSGVVLTLPLFCVSSTRVFNKILFSFFLSLSFFLLSLSFSTNLWFFFFIYELFFFPSFIIIFFCSPNTRFWSTLTYFTVWTQLGSLVLMVFFVFFYKNHGCLNFNEPLFTLSFFESILVLVGLGVKIPIWPFHFWLTKTHVEAPSFFSIYLSGFLVKTAVLGFFLVISLFNPNSIFVGITVFFIGSVDSTLKFLVQVDLKKLVAYTTIQEMNMIMILFFLTKTYDIQSLSLFIVLHTILSSLFFFIVDVIYKKYRTRSTQNIFGVINSNFFLGLFILLSVILFNALPFTIKFFIEIRLFLCILDFSFFMFVSLCFFVNFVGPLFFFKVWVSVLFSSPKKNKISSLSLKDHVFLSFFILIYLSLVFF